MQWTGLTDVNDDRAFQIEQYRSGFGSRVRVYPQDGLVARQGNVALIDAYLAIQVKDVPVALSPTINPGGVRDDSQFGAGLRERDLNLGNGGGRWSKPQ